MLRGLSFSVQGKHQIYLKEAGGASLFGRISKGIEADQTSSSGAQRLHLVPDECLTCENESLSRNGAFMMSNLFSVPYCFDLCSYTRQSGHC